jgi:exodeoxyribonuclease VII small subunit
MDIVGDVSHGNRARAGRTLARTMTDAPSQPADGGAFDDKLRALEKIVGELEQGGIGLEFAIERYQEGIRLLKDCHGALGEYRRRVEELTHEAEGAMRPFEHDPDVAERPPGSPRG